MKESLFAMLLALALASALKAQAPMPHTLTGRVVDEKQQPIAWAEIRFLCRSPHSTDGLRTALQAL